MKVNVLIAASEYNDTDPEVLGVFSSRERAEEAIPGWADRAVRIEEHGLDPEGPLDSKAFFR